MRPRSRGDSHVEVRDCTNGPWSAGWELRRDEGSCGVREALAHSLLAAQLHERANEDTIAAIVMVIGLMMDGLGRLVGGW